jgi:hypothetical protein
MGYRLNWDYIESNRLDPREDETPPSRAWQR